MCVCVNLCAHINVYVSRNTYLFIFSLLRYKDILLSMMERILHKLLLHYNIDELREIDDDAIDDDVMMSS